MFLLQAVRPHKATQCKQMREDARVAGASQLPDGDGRLFCLTCFKFSSLFALIAIAR